MAFNRNTKATIGCCIVGPLLLLASCTSTLPQPAPVTAPATTGPFSLDVPFVAAEPSREARGSDPAWSAAAAVVTLTPSVESPPSTAGYQPTTVRLCWTESALHVRFVCRDDDIHAPFEGRDAPLYKADVVEVFIDPVGDGRMWYEVLVSPRNDVFDSVTFMTGSIDSDAQGMLTPDADRQRWTYAAHDIANLRTSTRNEDGNWVVDIAIPAEELLRRSGARRLTSGAMRINFLRYDYPRLADQSRTLRATNWSPVRFGNPHRSPAAMGLIRLQPGADK
jgi:hypothetical protein